MAIAVKKAIQYLALRMHLRPVTKIKFSFDPYMPEAASVREVATTLHTPNILDSNQGTILKFDVKSDRSPPKIDVQFTDGHQLIFHTSHLSQLDILDRLYEFVDDKDPKKDEAPEILTKAAKGTKAKGKKRR